MPEPTQTVSVVYSDGSTASFESSPERTVIESADIAEVPLAFSCLAGICRACLAEDAESGETLLLCQTRVSADATYRLPYSQAAASVRPTKRRAKLDAFERVAKSVYRLDYRLEYDIGFLAGQYAAVAVPAETRFEHRQYRYFSMANSPSESARLRFYIRDLPDGLMSDYLARRARIDDLTTIAAPRGAFYLREDGDPKLLVAGGTGLAPLLSMLRQLAEASFSAPLTLVFGVTDSDDLFGIEEILTLQRALPDLQVVVTVMNGIPPKVETVAGTVVDGIEKAVSGARLAAVENAYLCGPPVMIEATREHLHSRLSDTATVHNEVFSPTDAI